MTGAVSVYLAYIGPGSGLAISFSFVTIVVVIITIIAAPIIYPIAALWHFAKRKRVQFNRGFRKVVVLGLDGLDPKLVRRLMDQGKLPNMSALADEGSHYDLPTVLPALTPAAWPSFMTGTDPSRHGIFDFISRDPQTYLPRLSASESLSSKRSFKIGRWTIPLSSPRSRLLRKGIPFWNVLAKNGLEVSVLRVPVTFPPERFGGRLLSGMFVPDLLGTQGTYSLYSDCSVPGDSDRRTVLLQFTNEHAVTDITGPIHPFRPGVSMRATLTIRRLPDPDRVQIVVGNYSTEVERGRWTPWIKVRFGMGLTAVHGIVRFFMKSAHPSFQLYMSPVHLDPERPAAPISYPSIYSGFLAKRGGTFGTLGLMEDTAAMNDAVLDEVAFLKQAWDLFDERKRMFLDTLDQRSDDVSICVFDTPDRIQHMFWRHLEPSHPASVHGNLAAICPNAIDEMLVRMDDLVAETRKRIASDTMLLVISDHGFNSFRRAVNLNSWLHQNGFLKLRTDGAFGADWLTQIDWENTRAYAMGLVGLYLNVIGREGKGIVRAGDDAKELARELKQKLACLVDSNGTRAIRRVYVTDDHYDGPYAADAPDLLIGYEEGYRCSWECAKGQVTTEVFCDNTRPWSGDHVVDPSIVPGVIFSNMKFARSPTSLMDVAPTVLDVFGLMPEAALQGRSLFEPGN